MKGLSRESRLLIDAARNGDEPSAADRRRVRTALARKIAVGAAAGVAAATATHAAAGGVAAGSAAAAGTSGAAGGALAGAGVAGGAAAAAGGTSIAAGAVATGFAAKLLLTVAIVGAVGAGGVGYARHEAAKAKVQAIADSHAGSLGRTVARTAPVAAPLSIKPAAPMNPEQPENPATQPPPESGGGAIEAPSPVAPSREARVLPPPNRGEAGRGASSAVTPPAAPTSPSDLDIEIALLQEANGAIRDRDGARALRLLDEHTRRFPKGAMGEESEAARVFALCQLGRTSEARDVAGRFLREHPRSPLAPRVSRACDADPSTF